MEMLREIIGKGDKKSKDNDKRSAKPAYRSSDASGEPDVGTKSYSRDKGVSRDDWGDRRQNERDTSSSYRGGDKSGSKSMGLGSERSLTGDSRRQLGQSSYSTLRGEDDTSRGSSRIHGSTEHSRRLNNDREDNRQDYSRYSSGATGASSFRNDETGDRSGRVQGSRGMQDSGSRSDRSSGGGMPGNNRSYGKYESGGGYYD